MAVVSTSFNDSFDSYNSSSWYTSDHAINEGWIDTNWSKNNVTLANGEVRLELNTTDSRGKEFTGGEIQTNDRYGYGRYEVTMKASGEDGVNSSFFTYTGPYFGHTWNEIDFEFLGKDPTKVSIAYHNGTTSWSRWVDLGFDASETYATYAFDWSEGKITWYVNGEELYTATGPNIPDTPGKVIMNIWTGMNSWLGEPTFSGSTSAHYRDVSYSPDVSSGPGDGGGGGGETPPTLGTLELHLIEADTGRSLGTITDGQTFKVSAADVNDLTVVAKVVNASGIVESVRFDLDGAIDKTAIENQEPYALFGDSDGALFGGMTSGSYSLKADAFSQDRATGTLRAVTDVNFTIEIESDGTGDNGGGGTGAPKGRIGFHLVDSNTGKSLGKITDGKIFEVAAADVNDLTVVATPGARVNSRVESIKFDLDGAIDMTVIDDNASYTLFGDLDGALVGGMKSGSYSLKADGFTLDGANGRHKAHGDVDFTINTIPEEKASTFEVTVLDANTGKALTTLDNGDTLDTTALGTSNFAFVATVDETAGTVESIIFELGGAREHRQVENLAPYSLFGDGRIINGRPFETGSYELDLDAYSEDWGGGSLLASQDFDFFVI